MVSQHRCGSFGVQVMTWLCALVLAAPLACGSAPDPAPGAEPSARDAGSAAPRGQTGGSSPATPQKAAGGADIPADIPIYPGAKIVESKSAKGGGYSIALETSDPIASVASKMSGLLEGKGWFVQQTERDSSFFFFAEKGNRSLTVVVESSGRARKISMLEVQL